MVWPFARPQKSSGPIKGFIHSFILQRHHNNAGSNLSADWLRKVEWKVMKYKREGADPSPRLLRKGSLLGSSTEAIRTGESPEASGNAAVSGAPSDKPVVEDIAAELEAPERPEMDGYISDASSLTRDLRKLWQTGDLEVTSDIASDDEDANVTAASAALLLRLAGGGADIALIQEPWIVCGKVSGLGSADYKLFVANAQAISLELQPAPIRLLACYMAYDQEGPFPENITQSLISDCVRNKIGLLAITEALTDMGIESRLVGLINQLMTSRAVTSKLTRVAKPLLKWQSGSATAVSLTDIVQDHLQFTIRLTSAAHVRHQVNSSTPATSVEYERHRGNADSALLGHKASCDSSILLNKDSIPPKTDYCMPTEHMITPFRTLIPRREKWAFEHPGKPGALFFYTDGSKLNNQAEILAINEALITLKNSYATSGTINIYSDSQAAIKSIAATTTKSLSVSKCRKSLHEMAEHFDICLIWVPGHRDIPGNCIADELARQGTTEILLPDKEGISMPLATCKLMLHTQSNLKSTLCWQNSLVGRVPRQTWPHIDKARTDALCNLSRVECSFVIRSLTGHWLIGIHAQRMSSPYNDFCRSCRDEEEEESLEHFFCSCPALMSRRLRTLGKPFLDGLGDLADIPPRKIAQFVQSSNWTPF
ncbi:hypothetical protein ACLKA6_008526 [Drosophila palustris]